MKKFVSKLLVALGLLTSGGAWAQTSGTVGLQQIIRSTTQKDYVGELAKPSTVTFEDIEVSYTSSVNLTLYNNRKRAAYLNKKSYYAIDMWRTEAKDGAVVAEFTDKQAVSVSITVPGGKVLNVSKINAQLLTNEIDYNWKVAIFDKKGNLLKETAKKTSKKADTTTPSISEDVSSDASLQNLTGTIVLRIYAYPDANVNRYCAIPYLTLDATLAEDTRKTKAITTSVDANGGGVVSPSGDYLCAVGDAAVITATPNDGYSFVSWLIDGTETVTENPYTFENVQAAHTAVASFAKNPVLSYAKPEGVYCVQRMFPANVNTVATGGKTTLPAANYMYYKEGYTMTGWNVGGTKYDFGAEVTLTEDVTAEPVFAANNTILEARKSDVTVTYDFNQSSNGGRIVNIQGNVDKVITRITVDGESIDYAMDADCTSGKLNNTNGTTAQCNIGTVLTIHDVEVGSVITLICNADDKFSTKTTFNGVGGTPDGKSITYTATEAGDVKVIVNNSNVYLTSITITYPYVAPTGYTLEVADTDFYTLYYELPVNIPEKVKAYTGKLSGNNLILTEITNGFIAAESAVILKAEETGSYTFTYNGSDEAFSAKYEDNDLLGVPEDTQIEELCAQGTVLTLGRNEDGVLGFRKPYETYVSAHKAYIDYVPTTPASFVKILLPGEATGIEAIQSVKKQAADGAMFNMMGQRVDANAKGLILMNGKKVIRK